MSADELCESIRKQIIRARKQQGITQSELAGMIGTKQSIVSLWETEGYTRYTNRTLCKIAEALNLELVIDINPRDEYQRITTFDAANLIVYFKRKVIA